MRRFALFSVLAALFLALCFAADFSYESAYAQADYSVDVADVDGCRILAFPYCDDGEYTFFAFISYGYGFDDSMPPDNFDVSVNGARTSGVLSSVENVEAFVAELSDNADPNDPAEVGYFSKFFDLRNKRAFIYRFTLPSAATGADLVISAYPIQKFDYVLTLGIAEYSEYIDVECPSEFNIDSEIDLVLTVADDLSVQDACVTFAGETVYIRDLSLTNGKYAISFDTGGVYGAQTCVLDGFVRKSFVSSFDLSDGVFLCDDGGGFFYGEPFSFVVARNVFYSDSDVEIFVNGTELVGEQIDGSPYYLDTGTTAYRYVVSGAYTKDVPVITSGPMLRNRLTVSVSAPFGVEFIDLESSCEQGLDYRFGVYLSDGYVDSHPTVLSFNGNYATLVADQGASRMWTCTVHAPIEDVSLKIGDVVPDTYECTVYLGNGATGSFNGQAISDGAKFPVVYGAECMLLLSHAAGYADFGFRIIVNGQYTDLPNIKDGDVYSIVIPAEYVVRDMTVRVADGFFADYEIVTMPGRGTTINISDRPMSEDGFSFSVLVSAPYCDSVPRVTVNGVEVESTSHSTVSGGVRYEYLLIEGIEADSITFLTDDLPLNNYSVTVVSGNGLVAENTEYSVEYGKSLRILLSRKQGYGGRTSVTVNETPFSEYEALGATLTDSDGVIEAYFAEDVIKSDLTIVFSDIAEDEYIMRTAEGEGCLITLSESVVKYGGSLIIRVAVKDGFVHSVPTLYVTTGQTTQTLSLTKDGENGYTAEYANVTADCLFRTNDLKRDVFAVTVEYSDGVDGVSYNEKAYYGYEYSMTFQRSVSHSQRTPKVTLNGAEIPTNNDGNVFSIAVPAEYITENLNIRISAMDKNEYGIAFFDMQGIVVLGVNAVELNGREAKVSYGDNFDFYVGVAENYTLRSITIYVDGKALSPTAENASAYRMLNVTENKTVTAVVDYSASAATVESKIYALPSPYGSMDEIFAAEEAILYQKRFYDCLSRDEQQTIAPEMIKKLDSLLCQLTTVLSIDRYRDGMYIEGLATAVPFDGDFYYSDENRLTRIYVEITEKTKKVDKPLNKFLRKNKLKFVSATSVRVYKTTVLGGVETTVDVTDSLTGPIRIGYKTQTENGGTQIGLYAGGEFIAVDHVETAADDGNAYICFETRGGEIISVYAKTKRDYVLLLVLIAVILGLMVAYYIRKRSDKGGKLITKLKKPVPPTISG